MKPKGTARRGRTDAGWRRGQAMVETMLVVLVTCLLFFGLFQISQWLAARKVLHHAAARGVRARTVGFNHWMVTKAVRVGAIPVSGRMLEPAFVNTQPELAVMQQTLAPGELWEASVRASPRSRQYQIERARIPEFMAARHPSVAREILDYELWNTDALRFSVSDAPALGEDGATGSLEVGSVSVELDYANWLPFYRSFYAADQIRLTGRAYLEYYFPVYIDDRGW